MSGCFVSDKGKSTQEKTTCKSSSRPGHEAVILKGILSLEAAGDRVPPRIDSNGQILVRHDDTAERKGAKH